MIKAYLFIIFFIFGIIANSQIVTVSSEMDKNKISGNGVLLGKQCDQNLKCERYFVLTATHISQGINTKIRLGSKEVANFVGRLGNSVVDLEILEIAKTEVPEGVVPLAVEANDTGIFINKFDISNMNKFRVVHKNSQVYSTITLYEGYYDSAGLPWLLVLSENQYFEPYLWHNYRMPPAVQLSADESFYIFPKTIQPGMSGSPILKGVDNYPMTSRMLAGIAIQFDFGFPESISVSYFEIQKLYLDYLGGKSYSNMPTWNANKNGTYRSWLGYSEINDTGNNKKSGQFAFSCCGGVGDAGDIKRSRSPEVLEYTSDLKKDGTNILGFDIDNGLLWADFHSLRYIEKNYLNTYKIIMTNEELIPFLEKKGAVLTEEVTAEDKSIGRTCSVRINSEKSKFQVQISPELSQIDLKFNSKGHMLSPQVDNEFKARRFIKTSEGDFLIDLRELFFIDIVHGFTDKPENDGLHIMLKFTGRGKLQGANVDDNFEVWRIPCKLEMAGHF